MEAGEQATVETPVRTPSVPAGRAEPRYCFSTFRPSRRPGPPSRPTVLLLLLFAAFLAAAAAWLWVLQSIPPRTPFVFFSDAYPAPYPVLGWIDEDRGRFESLDGLTLQVESAGFGDVVGGTPWERLESAIAALRPQVERSGVLVLDVRSIGVVDERGRPTLAPPAADPFDESGWIPLDKFLGRVREAAGRETRVLVVLDCLPRRTRWAAGWLHNEFPAAVESWATAPESRERLDRVTLVVRSGDGETRWRSRHRRGSVLQQTFWLGLAGKADESGNQNGHVEQDELVDYLRDSMPPGDGVMVFPKQRSGTVIAHSLPGNRIALVERDHVAVPDAALPDDARLADAWKRSAEVLGGDRWQSDLPATGRLLRALSWWESNLWSGRAGTAESEATAREVHRWLASLEREQGDPPLPSADYPLLQLQRQTGVTKQEFDDALGDARDLSRFDGRAELSTRLRTAAGNRWLANTSLVTMARLLAEQAPTSNWSATDVRRLLVQRRRYDALSVPGDVRVASRQSSKLDELRHSTLTAFDTLQIGGPDQQRLAAAALDDGEAVVRDLESRTAALRRLAVDCDRVRLELPFLAEWAAVHDAATGGRRRLTESMVLPLVRSLDEHDRALHGLSTDSGTDPFAGDSLRRQWNELRLRFEDEWRRLLQAKRPTTDDLDALERLLAAPLLPRAVDDRGRSPAEQRIVLLRRLVSTHAHEPDESRQDEPSQPRRDVAGHEHPALALVGSKAAGQPSGPSTSATDRLDVRFRRRLVAIERDEAAAGGGTESRREIVERLLTGRKGIALARNANNLRQQAFERSAWASRLVDLARGSLEEFWGPPREGAPPVVVQHVTTLLDVAVELDTAQRNEADQLRRRLDSAVTAKLLVDASSGSPVSPADRLDAEFSVSREHPGDGMPQGTARVALSDTRLDAPERAWAVPLGSITQERPFSLTVPLAPETVAARFQRSGPLYAEIGFRGHHFRSSFEVAPVGGRVVEVDVGPSTPTTFTVRSSQRRRASVVFVLDCSASMHESLRREGGSGEVRKLAAAVEALQGLLKELSGRPDTNVGVVLYGHRVSHAGKGPAPLVQQRYADAFPVPAGLMPYADVETVLVPGRFGPAEFGHVSGRLEKLLPWGETPLYLAVDRAVASLARTNDDGERHVVVITDGRDYQFNPPPDRRVSLQQVQDHARSAEAHVHLVGFGLSTEERSAARPAFESLADRTSGSAVLDVSRASELAARLRSLVGPSYFRWQCDEGESHSAEVNRPVTWRGRLPARLRVSYGGRSSVVVLQGGEAVELLGNVPSTPSRLGSASYDRRTPLIVPLDGRPESNPNLLLGVHAPSRTGDAAEFELSLRRSDGGYVPRPSAYAIHVQPLDDRGVPVGPPYLCNGSEFVDGMPAPVVRLRAEQWPETATAAAASFRVQSKPRDDAERIAVPKDVTLAAGTSDARLPELRWEIRRTPDFTQVVLRHEPGSLGVASVRVEPTAGPAIRSVRRRVDVVAGVASHTFFNARPALAADPLAFRLSGLGDDDSALRTTRPVRVRIGDDPDLVRPDAR